MGWSGVTLESFATEGQFFWQVKYFQLTFAFSSLPLGYFTANSDLHLGGEVE